MLVKMIEDNFVEQAVYRSAYRRHEMKNVRTLCIPLEPAFDSCELPRNAFHTGN